MVRKVPGGVGCDKDPSAKLTVGSNPIGHIKYGLKMKRRVRGALHTH